MVVQSVQRSPLLRARGPIACACLCGTLALAFVVFAFVGSSRAAALGNHGETRSVSSISPHPSRAHKAATRRSICRIPARHGQSAAAKQCRITKAVRRRTKTNEPRPPKGGTKPPKIPVPVEEEKLPAGLTEKPVFPIVPPPVEIPPVKTPPVETPPAEKPPVEVPPAEKPPVETPPAEKPAVEEPPVETPPAEKPAVEEPPVETPPAEKPAVEEPPVETPPAEKPAVEEPPVETPPAEKPPVEEPPVETPPAEKPPVETPPAEKPPVETPPAEKPPVEPSPHFRFFSSTSIWDAAVPASAPLDPTSEAVVSALGRQIVKEGELERGPRHQHELVVGPGLHGAW